MSLVGSLEDLGLGDILQIISLSRKSGILYLTGPPTSEGKKQGAGVVFKNGQVISASVSTARKRLGEIFVEKGLVATVQVREALHSISETQKHIRLDEALTKWFKVDSAPLQSAIRSHIEDVIYFLFGWNEGDFNFALMESEEELASHLQDPQLPVIDGGLNPQFLAMEGSRRRDERTGEETPSFLQQVPRLEETPTEMVKEVPISRKVVLADDDPVTLLNLERIVTGLGCEAYPVGSVGEALAVLDDLSSRGEVAVLVADLIMPKQDGKGMLGGMELLEESKKRAAASPVIIITDIVDRDTERKVMESGGYAYLFKPRKSQVSRNLVTPAIRDFEEELGKTLKAILPPSEQVAPAFSEPSQEQQTEVATTTLPEEASLTPEPSPLAQEDKEGLAGLTDELKSLETYMDFLPEEVPRQPTTPGLQLLKSMIDELVNPKSHSDITLLVLRFASEIMSRSVLFLVRRDEVCGLGQFGIVLEADNPEIRVRAMKVPLEAQSIFRDVVESKTFLKKGIEETPWNDYLIDQFGGYRPVEIFIAPIFSGGRIVSILYGDNCPEGGEIGDTTSLEIFLAQAGLALDRALLERKLKDLRARVAEGIRE